MPINILYPDDLKFGVAQEEIALPKLREFFKRDIKRTDDPYAPFDFFDEEYYYEMKSRKNNHNKYPTTLITADKVVGENKKIILLFNFTDGLYYIEYNKDKFNTYSCQAFSRAGVAWNAKQHYYIPIGDLTPIF